MTSLLAARLREYRAAAGLSQDELAGRLHVTRQAVSHWETGRSEPDLETLARLAQELGTDTATPLGEHADTVMPPAPLSAAPEREPAGDPPRSPLRRCATPVVLGALFVILFIADIWLGRYARTEWMSLYDTRFFYLYIFLYRFLLFGLLGAALAAAANALSGGRVRFSRGLRIASLCASLLALTVFYTALIVWLGGHEATGVVLNTLYRLLSLFLQSEQIRVLFPLFSGLLLYFGLKK